MNSCGHFLDGKEEGTKRGPKSKAESSVRDKFLYVFFVEGKLNLKTN